jgi:hypothetical protein
MCSYKWARTLRMISATASSHETLSTTQKSKWTAKSTPTSATTSGHCSNARSAVPTCRSNRSICSAIWTSKHSATTSTAATMPIGSSLPSRHHQQAPHRQGAHRFGVAGNALKKPSRKNAAVPDVPADNPEGTMDRFRHGLRRVLSARSLERGRTKSRVSADGAQHRISVADATLLRRTCSRP